MSLLKIDSVVYEPEEDCIEDDFPAFVVSGIFLPTGEKFTRKVSIELDGRDVDEEHVDGLDLDQVRPDYDQEGQLSEALYEAVAGCAQYQEMAAEYHGGW